MRAVVQRFARRWWQGELPVLGFVLGVVSAPLSWLWSGVTALRNARYDRSGGARVEGLVVLSVGNLAVGGTGKTPLASWLATRCAAAGARPVLLLSGYARDEVLLHERWTPAVAVIADRDRVASARAAARRGADVGVLDDGFQHRRIARDLDIVLLAAEEAFPGATLPRGPYREGARALDRADAVVVTRRTAPLQEAEKVAAAVRDRFEHLVVAGAYLGGGAWLDLSGRPAPAPASDVLAVAAVARPTLFADTVRPLVSGSVELAPFADHHDYSGRDVVALKRRARSRTIVVTEKDAVKLVAHRDRLGEARVLAQELSWDWGEEELMALVHQALGDAAP